MANNKGIQILRTDLHGITSARQNLEILAGQPLYNAQKNYLTVGGPTGGGATYIFLTYIRGGAGARGEFKLYY